MKKFVSILLALVMIMGLATTAFAADTLTKVTINNPNYSNLEESKIQYKGYKLLIANVSAEDDKFGYDLQPADGNGKVKYRTELISALGLASTATDTEIVNAINALGGGEPVRHFASAMYDAILAAGLEPEAVWTGSTTNLTEGYWLIADVSDLEGLYLSNSVVMIDTVGSKDVTVTAKPSILTSEKKVDDENDSIMDPTRYNEDAKLWVDVADYDIGDAVPFNLSVTIPNNATSYKYYSFIMQDSASEGLTYNPDSFKITVNNAPRTIGVKGTAGVDFWYEIDTDVTIPDPNDANKTITVSQLFVYPAHSYTNYDNQTVEASRVNGGDYLQLFDSSVAHSAINSVDVVMTYTATLNEKAKIGIEGNPNYYTVKFSNDPDDDGFGQTPIDTNIILTYKVIFNKTDAHQTPLVGADFDLYKFIALAGIENETDEAKVAEAKAKAVAALPAGVEEKDLFNHPAAIAWGYFEKIDASKKTGDTTGSVFTFTGLDDGYYKVDESVVPDGYNGIDPIEFRIVANHVQTINGESILTSLEGRSKVGGEIVFSADTGAGSLSTTIVNRTGTELPTTGGIGTTLFYVIGSVMLIGAVLLLITKKRMSFEA